MGLCTVCKMAVTSNGGQVAPGEVLYICPDCLDSAKQNFIWICLRCRSAYVRPKELVIKQIEDPELRKAYSLCRDQQIVQGIDTCVECNPGESADRWGLTPNYAEA